MRQSTGFLEADPAETFMAMERLKGFLMRLEKG